MILTIAATTAALISSSFSNSTVDHVDLDALMPSPMLGAMSEEREIEVRVLVEGDDGRIVMVEDGREREFEFDARRMGPDGELRDMARHGMGRHNVSELIQRLLQQGSTPHLNKEMAFELMGERVDRGNRDFKRHDDVWIMETLGRRGADYGGRHDIHMNREHDSRGGHAEHDGGPHMRREHHMSEDDMVQEDLMMWIEEMRNDQHPRMRQGNHDLRHDEHHGGRDEHRDHRGEGAMHDQYMEQAEQFANKIAMTAEVGSRLSNREAMAIFDVWQAREHVGPNRRAAMMRSISDDADMSTPVRNAASWVLMEAWYELGDEDAAANALEAFIRRNGS